MSKDKEHRYKLWFVANYKKLAYIPFKEKAECEQFTSKNNWRKKYDFIIEDEKNKTIILTKKK